MLSAQGYSAQAPGPLLQPLAEPTTYSAVHAFQLSAPMCVQVAELQGQLAEAGEATRELQEEVEAVAAAHDLTAQALLESGAANRMLQTGITAAEEAHRLQVGGRVGGWF